MGEGERKGGRQGGRERREGGGRDLGIAGRGGDVVQRLLLGTRLVLGMHALVGVGVDGPPAPWLVVVQLFAVVYRERSVVYREG